MSFDPGAFDACRDPEKVILSKREASAASYAEAERLKRYLQACQEIQVELDDDKDRLEIQELECKIESTRIDLDKAQRKGQKLAEDAVWLETEMKKSAARVRVDKLIQERLGK